MHKHISFSFGYTHYTVAPRYFKYCTFLQYLFHNGTLIFQKQYGMLFPKGVTGVKKSALAVERCKMVSAIQRILGGKWKIEILYYIAFQDIHRFGALRRHIGDITESSLTKQLRELEADGFLIRHDYREVPPRVEYTLTDLGKSFIPVFEHMKQWGEENLGDENAPAQ